MLNPKVEKLVNEQINKELYSAYLYQAMAAYFAAGNLPGMAHWMNAQTQEEVIHAFKFYNHIVERGGRVVLEAIEKPPVEWDSPLAAFEAALKHEQHVTDLINKLVALSSEQKDQSSYNFLQWFVGEQVEEEASVSEIIGQLKIIGTSGSGLFMLDRELSKRTFTMPAAKGPLPSA